jgi:hypothetical protein
MEQLRVVDLAHTMGITSRELIFKLRSIGVTVAGEEDTLDLATVRAIITGETLQRRPREVIVRREKKEEETTTVSAKDRLARRRKRQVVETEKEIKEVVTEAKPSEATDEAEVDEVAVEDVAEVEAIAEETIEAEIDEAVEIEPEVEITEEEITAEREPSDDEEAPKRVRPARAKTPLEQSLRELTQDEIRQRLADQKEVEKKLKTEKVTDRGTGRKAKAAADAKEIRDLLNKFEEQKLKGQEESKPPTRPAPRPGRASCRTAAADQDHPIQGRRETRGPHYPVGNGDRARAGREAQRYRQRTPRPADPEGRDGHHQSVTAARAG